MGKKKKKENDNKTDEDKKKKDKKDKNKNKDKDPYNDDGDDDKDHDNENDHDNNDNKYEDYDSVYAVDKECESFTDYDRESVKTHNCTRKKCHFKCKRGYDHINTSFAECKPNQRGDGGTWSNDAHI